MGPPKSRAIPGATTAGNGSRPRPTWPRSPQPSAAPTTCAAATASVTPAPMPTPSSTPSPAAANAWPPTPRPCSASSISTTPESSTRPSPTPWSATPSVPGPSRTASTNAPAPGGPHRPSPCSCRPTPACGISASHPIAWPITTASSPRHPDRRIPMALLADALKLLGLHHTAAHLDDLVALATKRRWSPTQLLEHLVSDEQQERARRSLERRLLRSGLGRFTPMDAFDWAWPKRIDRAAVEAALRLEFMPETRNLALVAPQGLGKPMIAQNIAHQAVLAGHHVLFTTAAQLLLDLGSQDSARGLARRLNAYGQRGLLVLDELGYLSYDARAADLLFQVVSRRYERNSLVLTTNLAFSDWPTIFPNAGSAIALIDRLIHHAEIITIEGESYRRRAAEVTRKAPRSKPTS